MDFIQEISIFKNKLDPEIKRYFERVISETKKIDPVMTEALEYSKKIILSRGKRLRPALMYYGYLASGGKETEKILKASVSIELVHTFLLIHDDIMDRDRIRHGMDSVNFHYEKMGNYLFPFKDNNHFGNSMALIIGDMIGALGSQIIFESNFKPELIMKALSKLQSVISYTVIGQAKDIFIGYGKKVSEEDILKMYEYKTAKYTVEGPLHLGAILGGGDEKLAEALSGFAIPIGVAFQIQDDILGLFGSEKKLGKRVGADISEGKQTLIILKAINLANREQKNFLKKILGKKDISKEEMKKIQAIIMETGAYDYAKKMARNLVQKGWDNLRNISISKDAKFFLKNISEYMIKRDF